ncbi:MAG: hypothetical protein NTU98_13080 [Bacteroidetes bacterium]|nr:hypothetical protein [Bacteroidota bacterium]
MHWYHWISLASLGICLLLSLVHLIRLIRLGRPTEYATPAGKINPAIGYSFTGAMSPAKKETAFLHLPTYFAGIAYHLGTFLAILLFFLSWTGITYPVVLRFAMAIFLLATSGCGSGILIKRMLKKGLRSLSNPDDYISNILVTFFQMVTAVVLLWDKAYPVYFILTSMLLLYFPAGKLKHAIYFFAARYHLGFFYGWRGVWPPKQA